MKIDKDGLQEVVEEHNKQIAERSHVTETMCPTCGARCEKTNEETVATSSGYMPIYDLNAIPPPDLIKLREVYNEYKDLAGPCMRHKAFPIIMQAIKELLEEDK